VTVNAKRMLTNALFSFVVFYQEKVHVLCNTWPCFRESVCWNCFRVSFWYGKLSHGDFPTF